MGAFVPNTVAHWVENLWLIDCEIPTSFCAWSSIMFFVLCCCKTEGYTGAIQMWCRLPAFPFGQQAQICLKGRCSVDHAGPSDRCGRCCWEWPHHRLLGKQQRGSLPGEVVIYSAAFHRSAFLQSLREAGGGDVTPRVWRLPFVLCAGTPGWGAICVQQGSWWHHGREGQQEPFLWPQPEPPLHHHREKGVFMRDSFGACMARCSGKVLQVDYFTVGMKNNMKNRREKQGQYLCQQVRWLK